MDDDCPRLGGGVKDLLNCAQTFTRILYSHLPAAESMSPGSRRKLLPLVYQIQPEPPSVVFRLCVYSRTVESLLGLIFFTVSFGLTGI